MASFIQQLLGRFFPATPHQNGIVMMGLDGSGKTTLLRNLRLGEFVSTYPTIGFQVDTMSYQDLIFYMWGIGGNDKIRPLWRHYWRRCQALIFVLDSTDRESLDNPDVIFNVRDQLERLYPEEEIKAWPILIYASKQDLPNAMTVQEIDERLHINRVAHSRLIHVQGCSGVSGEGLQEGLDWLTNAIGHERIIIPISPVPVDSITQGLPTSDPSTESNDVPPSQIQSK